MKLSRASKVTASSIILLSLFGGSFSDNAGQNPERAAERAQVRAEFRTQMDTFITTRRAIADERRNTVTKVNNDYQAALATATTDEEIVAAKQARKAAINEAKEAGKSKILALAKPIKPTKMKKAGAAPKA